MNDGASIGAGAKCRLGLKTAGAWAAADPVPDSAQILCQLGLDQRAVVQDCVPLQSDTHTAWFDNARADDCAHSVELSALMIV